MALMVKAWIQKLCAPTLEEMTIILCKITDSLAK